MKISRLSAIVLKVFPKVQDEIIDGAGGGVDLIAPDDVEDSFPGYHFIFVFDQKLQEHGLLFGEFDQGSVGIECLLGLKIDPIGSECIQIVDLRSVVQA
jgi:hypothetical protein